MVTQQKFFDGLIVLDDVIVVATTRYEVRPLYARNLVATRSNAVYTYTGVFSLGAAFQGIVIAKAKLRS